MVVLEIFGVYLALAALFYLGLTAAAVDASVVPQNHRSRWQRARSLKERAMRRLRPLMTLRLPKHKR